MHLPAAQAMAEMIRLRPDHFCSQPTELKKAKLF
jgi:hypothetical protein